MAQIPPIDDSYIDEIIKAQDVYNPGLNKTQGVKLRELVKLLRDRLEQETMELSDSKVDKLTGYQLSQESYSPEEKSKLAGLREHFRGYYISVEALTAAVPTGSAGDYAFVDQGPDTDAQMYVWDTSDNKWVASAGGSNVLDTVLTGIDFDSVAAVLATDNILTAFGKLQAQLNGLFKIPAGGTAGQVLTKIDGTDGNTAWISNQVPGGIINITYGDLLIAIANSTLIPGEYYRITDFQTTHNIQSSSPNLLNTGPVEPLVFQAITANKLSSTGRSETYPGDEIHYTVANTISGSSKGVILRRIDTLLNVDVCNDFRVVKYRRWKLTPVAWDPGIAYTLHQAVQYTDGAIYYCNNPGGVAAGDIPSDTSDNWAMFLPNNNYYYNYRTTNYRLLTQGQAGTTPPTIPTDLAAFGDFVMFQDYDSSNATLYYNVKIDGAPGQLINLVFFRKAGQTQVIKNSYIGFSTNSSILNSTIIADAGNYGGLNIKLGIVNSLMITTGSSGVFYTDVATINTCHITSSIWQNNKIGNLSACHVRKMFQNVNILHAQYCIFPNNVNNLFSPGVIGNLKCYTNAFIKSTYMNYSFDTEYNSVTEQSAVNSAAAPVWVRFPLSGKVFIGAVPIDGNNYQQIVAQSAINRAATRKIIFVGADQPSEKTIIKITDAAAKVIAWQSALVPFNANNDYHTGGDSVAVATYFSRHGNDFQVQQKDLIAGVWTINHSPTYSIDTVDVSDNVSQVTFTPGSGATETRFIIV